MGFLLSRRTADLPDFPDEGSLKARGGLTHPIILMGLSDCRIGRDSIDIQKAIRRRGGWLFHLNLSVQQVSILLRFLPPLLRQIKRQHPAGNFRLVGKTTKSLYHNKSIIRLSPPSYCSFHSGFSRSVVIK